MATPKVTIETPKKYMLWLDEYPGRRGHGDTVSRAFCHLERVLEDEGLGAELRPRMAPIANRMSVTLPALLVEVQEVPGKGKKKGTTTLEVLRHAAFPLDLTASSEGDDWAAWQPLGLEWNDGAFAVPSEVEG
jgi:hypothetical protein